MKSAVLGLEGVFCQLLDIFVTYGGTSSDDDRIKFIRSFLVDENGENLKDATEWLRLTYASSVPPEVFAVCTVLVDGEERLLFNLAIEELLKDLRKDFPETVPK